jgi:SAM-dependent methyltransferase
MAATPWYREMFNEDYLRLYEPTLTPERTEREVEGIVELLALPAGSTILDLCCGHGRHSIPLALRGYRVTGQDLSEVFLGVATSDAEARGADVRWLRSDMREIPFESEFDAVINIFTAFGYLESDDEDEKVVRAVHRALKPGGRFLLETMHRDSLLRRLQPQGIQRLDDGLLMLEERQMEPVTGRQLVRRTLIHPDGRRDEYHFALRLYSATELARIFRSAGFEVEVCYGGLDGSPLTLDSHRLAMIGKK